MFLRFITVIKVKNNILSVRYHIYEWRKVTEIFPKGYYNSATVKQRAMITELNSPKGSRGLCKIINCSQISKLSFLSNKPGTKGIILQHLISTSILPFVKSSYIYTVPRHKAQLPSKNSLLVRPMEFNR